jgi:hypothetical protein
LILLINHLCLLATHLSVNNRQLQKNLSNISPNVHSLPLWDSYFPKASKKKACKNAFHYNIGSLSKKRVIAPYPLSKFFDFVKIHDNPDFSLRRVGVYAGKLDDNIQKSIQSHYFIKIKTGLKLETFSNLYNTINFTHDNTAGPKSISKKEFILAINQLLL